MAAARRTGPARLRGRRSSTDTPAHRPGPGGAATAALVLVGGGVFAYSALDGGGSQPEAALPDTAFAYARVDLDPRPRRRSTCCAS
ncbi:hypothetical protein NKG05_18810 [Oerskovia sp. M15]